MSNADSKWGFSTKNIKWVLYERAPFTGSGLNEIIATARTRAQLMDIAKILRIQVSAKGYYSVIKMDDIRKKDEL